MLLTADMFSRATPTAAKQVGAAADLPYVRPWSLLSVWLSVQATVQRVFGIRPARAGAGSLRVSSQAPHAPNSLPPVTSAAPIKAPTFIASYFETIESVIAGRDWSDVVYLVETLERCWREGRQLFLCGNGGSAANAIHLANDFLYGIDKVSGRGLRVTALPANAAVMTCLANDIAYEDIFSQQLTVQARRGDVLIVLSGSGNSPNIVKALRRAREMGVVSFAILGFAGGKSLALADHPIYFPVNDMQVAEDLQMMVGHMAMQRLARHPCVEALNLRSA
jgi:D-sedoheptulose 7-phosphate isomerase